MGNGLLGGFYGVGEPGGVAESIVYGGGNGREMGVDRMADFVDFIINGGEVRDQRFERRGFTTIACHAVRR